MKRRTDKKRSPAEIKADNSRHYGEMAGSVPSKKVEESFKRLACKNKGSMRDDSGANRGDDKCGR